MLPRRKEEVKNIAELIKDDMETVFIPKKSIGKFAIGDRIDKFLEGNYDYYPKNENYSYDLYSFYDPTIDVYTDDKGLVDSVRCSNICTWKGQNLIGMAFSEFIALSELEPDSSEKIYLIVDDKGQNQTVYEFNKLRLQVWTWRNKIVTVILY